MSASITGSRFLGYGVFLLLKLGGLLHAVTDPQRGDDQHDAEDERNAPAPAQKLRIGSEVTG